MRRIVLPAALALLTLSSAADAHPKLISASPAANATVVRAATVEMRFSEKLLPKFSGAELSMTGHAGTHAPMKIATVASISGDGLTLVLTPRSPLGSGRYSVAWHVVTADTHRIAGNFTFAVK